MLSLLLFVVFVWFFLFVLLFCFVFPMSEFSVSYVHNSRFSTYIKNVSTSYYVRTLCLVRHVFVPSFDSLDWWQRISLSYVNVVRTLLRTRGRKELWVYLHVSVQVHSFFRIKNSWEMLWCSSKRRSIKKIIILHKIIIIIITSTKTNDKTTIKYISTIIDITSIIDL